MTIAPERATSEQDEHPVHPADSPRYPGCNHHHEPATDRQRLGLRQFTPRRLDVARLRASTPTLNGDKARTAIILRVPSETTASISDDLIVPLAHANRLNIKAFAIELFCGRPSASGGFHSRFVGLVKFASWRMTRVSSDLWETDLPSKPSAAATGSFDFKLSTQEKTQEILDMRDVPHSLEPPHNFTGEFEASVHPMPPVTGPNVLLPPAWYIPNQLERHRLIKESRPSSMHQCKPDDVFEKLGSLLKYLLDADNNFSNRMEKRSGDCYLRRSIMPEDSVGRNVLVFFISGDFLSAGSIYQGLSEVIRLFFLPPLVLRCGAATSSNTDYSSGAILRRIRDDLNGIPSACQDGSRLDVMCWSVFVFRVTSLVPLSTCLFLYFASVDVLLWSGWLGHGSPLWGIGGASEMI
ncbi:hypothetical protein DFH09DRAFT_1082271 [Mycena vulgaris]|nr:hypothetical protein DFH09DRAFT_1082271 [Mycena vulgaris]